MTSRRTPETPQSRRERRAAARRNAPPGRPSQPSRRPVSPMLLITIAAAVVGIAIVGFLVLQNPGTATAGPIRSPAVTTPPALAHDRTLGSANAPVKLEVYSDFQCPNCELFWTTVEPTVVKDEVATGRAQLIYHDFSFIGPESLAAAVAARCADQQGDRKST